VPRSSIARAFALLAALAGGLAVPLSALAHGHAHQHEAIDHETRGRAGLVADASVVAEEEDHGAGDHPHPGIGAALTSKVATPLVALPAPRVTVPPAAAVGYAPAAVDPTVERFAPLAHAPPPRLRAPPA